MDNFGTYLNKLVKWLDSGPLPSIPFVGQGGNYATKAPAPHIELIFVTSGGWPEFQVGDKTGSLVVNEVSIHSVHFGNHAPPTKKTSCWCIFFDISDTDVFAELAHAPLFEKTTVSQPTRLSTAFERVSMRARMHKTIYPHYLDGPWAYTKEEHADHTPTTMEIYLKASVLELLAILKDETEGIGIDETQSRPIREAMSFMATHYKKPGLKLSEIAEAASLSVDHFGRVFKARTGISPMHYLRDLRIEHARLLLSETQLRVNEVAWNVGFDDPLHFSRSFHAKTGVSAAKYRKAHENKKTAIVQ